MLTRAINDVLFAERDWYSLFPGECLHGLQCTSHCKGIAALATSLYCGINHGTMCMAFEESVIIHGSHTQPIKLHKKGLRDTVYIKYDMFSALVSTIKLLF